jgi:hypothetical protein
MIVSSTFFFQESWARRVSDLCQHVDQHFEIGGLYTFKQPMNLLMNRVLDHSEQFLKFVTRRVIRDQTGLTLCKLERQG